MTRFIDDHREQFGVQPICDVLGWNVSTYYAHRRRPPSERALRDDHLAVEVRRVFEANYRVYGYRKVHAQLRREGFTIAECTVRRLMRREGLAGAVRGWRKPRTTTADATLVRPPDLLDRDFTAAGPDRRWVADLTYVRLTTGRFVYAAVIADVFSRKIVGWAVADHLRTELPLAALRQALWERRHVDLDGLIHHSDAGGQGGLKRPSQHLEETRSWDGTLCWMDLRTDRTAAAALTGAPAGVARRGSRAVLVGDRRWREHRGCRRDGGRVTRGRVSVVSSWRWHADRAVQGALGPLPVVRGARGDRGPARPGAVHPPDLSGARAIAVDDLAGVAPQCCDRGGRIEYRASVAQWHCDRRARRPKVAELVANEQLRDYVQQRLAGEICRPDGTLVSGPTVAFKGRRHGRRQDRRWARAWSPEQIANRLPIDFPDDPAMRISHEAICQALYIQGRGALKRELTQCLRTGRALRVPRARARRTGKKFIPDELKIAQRPPEVDDRAIPGHWEGDLIIGTGWSAIGTLVERTTRFTMLLHLPPMPGHRDVVPQPKHSAPLAGRGAEAVRDAIVGQLGGLPPLLRRSLTWDQGSELAQHAELRLATDIDVWFCDPHSPWQRGTNENTNGLLRQYFPRGTDLARHSRDDLDAVALALNTRPRKTLGFRTPAEALEELLASAEQAGVATTH